MDESAHTITTDLADIPLHTAAGKALHVPPEAFYGYRYYLDQIEPPFNYTSNVASLVGTYLRLIPEYKVLSPLNKYRDRVCKILK